MGVHDKVDKHISKRNVNIDETNDSFRLPVVGGGATERRMTGAESTVLKSLVSTTSIRESTVCDPCKNIHPAAPVLAIYRSPWASPWGSMGGS
jgi:hypothetical protein